MEDGEDAATRNVAAFSETQTAGRTAECVELQDLEQPSGEFSRLIAEDDAAAEPARASAWRQIRALMKIRMLTERRMPTIWFGRFLVPIVMVLCYAMVFAVPASLSTFEPFQLKAGLYVNDSNDNRSTANPGLAFVNASTAGLYFFTRDARGAKRGIAIVSCPSVSPSVTLVYRWRVCWVSSKLIIRIISLGSSLLEDTASAMGTPPKFGWNRDGVESIFLNDSRAFLSIIRPLPVYLKNNFLFLYKHFFPELFHVRLQKVNIVGTVYFLHARRHTDKKLTKKLPI